jgi:salicylate hydroxylase
MHVVICGAGIGGLAAAHTCLQAGFEVTLLEQARALREIGTGVQISSNGTKVLSAIGLGDAIDAVGVRSQSFQVLSYESGEQIAEFPLGETASSHYGDIFYQLHRADLLDALRTALPDGTLRLGARVDRIEQDADSAAAILESGESVRGDVLIGADGIHSAVRRSIGIVDDARFSGKLVWRALVPADRITEYGFGENFYGYTGRDRMVWAYWVRPGKQFNFGGVVPSDEVHLEGWDETGDLDELRASFADANPRLAGLIGAIDEAFITGLYDRDPLENWTQGRVTLLGDSAHAMLPYLAQGACQSLEDAAVLALCLQRHGSAAAPAALADYELRRRPRTTKVQATARATSIFWLENDPVQIRARNGRMKGLAQIDPLSTTVWKWLYEYDPIEAGTTGRIAPDKRGLRHEYDTDDVHQKRAWHMWHDLFTTEEESGGLLGLRRGYDRFFSQFRPSGDTAVTEVTIGAATGLAITPSGSAGDGPVVLHFHGGGYCFGSAACSVEYGERLARAVSGTCLALEYRLAPEHPYPAALEDAVAAWHCLAERHAPSDIFFSGESAGCGLALAAAMKLRDTGEALPAGIIALSPFVDCTLKSDSIDRLAGEDPIIERDTLTYMATNYFQANAADDPLVSPIYGNYHGLPPLLIQAGRNEVLVDEATRLEARAKDAGIDVTCELYDERLHIFSMFPFLPNAANALGGVAGFAQRIRG